MYGRYSSVFWHPEDCRNVCDLHEISDKYKSCVNFCSIFRYYWDYVRFISGKSAQPERSQLRHCDILVNSDKICKKNLEKCNKLVTLKVLCERKNLQYQGLDSILKENFT